MQKNQSENSQLDKENSQLDKENNPKKEDLESELDDALKKPEDNTRYGDWVKNGRTIDF
jgi:hypothetical protein